MIPRMPAPFKESEPDPTNRADQRKRQRIAALGKGAKQQQLNWAARYDAKVSHAPPPPEVPADELAARRAAAAPPPVPAGEEFSTSTVVPSSVVLPTPQLAASSAGKPLPVPALAPMSGAAATVAKPSTSAPKSPPTPTPAPKPGAPTDDGPMFPTASAEVQAARKEALDMVVGQIAVAFEELHVGVETTMQSSKVFAFPREFWQGSWKVMTVGMLNRYLPDWMSGLLVEGVAVGLPPAIVFNVAHKLEKAGYQLGVPGEPGRARGRSVAQAAPEAPQPRQAPSEPAPAPSPPTEAGEAKEGVPKPNLRSDSVANPPARKHDGKVDVTKAFSKGGGPGEKN